MNNKKHTIFHAIFTMMVFWGMPLLVSLYLIRLDWHNSANVMIACGIPITLVYSLYLAFIQKGEWFKSLSRMGRII